MAYEKKPLEDEKQDGVLQGNEGEGVKQLSQSADVLQPGGTVQDASQTGTGQAPVTPTGGQDVSTQQKYLEANKQKALDLAAKTSGVVTGDITAAQNALTAAGDQYKTDVGAGTVNLNQDIYGRAASALTDQTAQDYNQALLDQFMADEANKTAFNEQYNAAYGGPRDIYSQDYYAQAKRDAEKAQRTAGLIGDSAGRQELIARTYDNPSGRFSAGTLALDEALLSGTPEGYDQLLAAADTGLGLENQMTGLGEMSEKEYLDAIAKTEATQKAYRDEFNLGKEEGEIQTRTQAIQEKAKTDYEDYLKYIQDTYGVQEGVQASTYFDRPQDYLNVQAQNVASQEDYARLKALEELTGGYSTLTPFESQAGQYSNYINPAEDFRQSDFQTAVDTNKANRLAREKAEDDRLYAIQKAQADAAAAAKKAKKKNTYKAAAAVFVIAACFDKNSQVEMEDGSLKEIKDINVGDTIKDGGEVYKTLQHVNTAPMYNYKDVIVTGSHAVKEGSKFVRVEDSEIGVESNEKCDVVYSLCSEKHRIIINGVEFADYDEVDNGRLLSLDECLAELNRVSL